MTSPTTRNIGKEGEDIACAYLESKGWRILDRNYFFEKSEVDIVAYDDTAIVFVEVKYRTSAKYGRPEEYVTDVKAEHVFKAAEAWMYERKMDGSPMRFDVIGILQEGNHAPEIKHIPDAFR